MSRGAFLYIGCSVLLSVAFLAAPGVRGEASVFYDGDPLDYPDGLSRTVGSAESKPIRYHRDVHAYVSALPAAMAAIEAVIAERDWEAIRLAALELEKSSERIGARGVRLYSEQLKILSRVRRPGKLHPNLKQLQLEADAVVQHVKSNAKKFEIPATPTAPAADAAPNARTEL